jgi:hypothetical protein
LAFCLGIAVLDFYFSPKMFGRKKATTFLLKFQAEDFVDKSFGAENCLN